MMNGLRWCAGGMLIVSWWSLPAVRAADDESRPSFWVDLYEGEPVAYETVLEDLHQARVIYLGERHTIPRHHEMETQIIADLAKKGVPLVIGLEQMETPQQSILDRFNEKEIDFEQLAELTGWGKRWSNYQQYRPALEAARHAGAPLLALNAKSEIIRQVARGGGVDKLEPHLRQELPADMQLKDPLYERLLSLNLMVHMAATPEKLQPMIEAQMARDETMAATLVNYLSSDAGSKRTAVVLCGSGHVSYGLATVDRVRRRMPGVRDRIVIFSESGDVKLSPEELKAARAIEITHEQLREINRPFGDYLYATGMSHDESNPATQATEAQPAHTEPEAKALCEEFHIPNSAFHFPPQSYLEAGYAPPGGYVKDFSIIKHGGRYHLFHIDGRPEERCTETGNEISFGHASTTDLRHWVRHLMPLAVGDRAWENEHCWAPFVTEWKGKFYMFYMASGVGHDGVLTYAVSDDLEKWTKWEDGAIREAGGRDPFARVVNDELFLYYTANEGGIKAVKTRDMVHWTPCGAVMRNEARLPAESSSCHPFKDGYVLWYNDYLHCNDPTGDFRAVYAFSKDPLKFEARNIKVLDFKTSLPTRYAADDWVEKRPIPVSIELMERSERVWLVSYFRWHVDRFRLFFGALYWDSDPARIEEIVTADDLRRVLEQIKK